MDSAAWHATACDLVDQAAHQSCVDDRGCLPSFYVSCILCGHCGDYLCSGQALVSELNADATSTRDGS